MQKCPFFLNIIYDLSAQLSSSKSDMNTHLDWMRGLSYQITGNITLCVYNSNQHWTNILEKKYRWHWRRKRTEPLRHSTRLHTSGKSNHFWGTKRLIFFPLDLPAWRSTSVALWSMIGHALNGKAVIDLGHRQREGQNGSVAHYQPQSPKK